MTPTPASPPAAGSAASPRPATGRGSRGSRGRKRGWVPVQHGAWAFVTVPFVVGMVPAGPTWTHLPLGVFWLAGYLAFQAGSLWLKAKRKAGLGLPAAVYAAVAAASGIVVVVLDAHLARWIPAFVPLLAIAAFCALARRERTLLGNAATVVAACLMTIVAADAGARPDLAEAGLAALTLLGYFFGTVLYVKTMIRERGQRRWYVASIAYHASLAVAHMWVSWWLAGFFVVMTVRAALGPRLRWSVRAVGFGEVAASTALAVILLVT